MSGKVLATIAQTLTVDVIDAMADRAEMDHASARKAAELAVPAILSALTELVARPDGAARLTRVLAQRSIGPGPAPDGRGDAAAPVLGAEQAGALASAIGRFVGAPERSAYAFLDDLTLMLLCTLAREGEQTNAGGKGLANLLTAEKDLIAAAMPAGLSSLLCADPSFPRLGEVVGTIAERGTARRPIQLSSRRAATASAGRRRSQGARAFWAVLVLALAAVAWYVLAANIKQTGGGGGDVATWRLLEAAVRPRAEADVADLDLANLNGSAPDQGTALRKLAAETLGAARDVLAGLDAIAPALVRLGHFFGLREDGIAGPALRLRTRQHENGDAGPSNLDTASADPPGRWRLRFVSPEFRTAVSPPFPTAVDKPAGPTIAAH
jgi:hypothetical protein